MSGHSKWSKIKHAKAITDAKKSKMFGKLVRFITVEAKKAGGDRNAPGVRVAVEKAKAANVPSDTIERALAKAAADKSVSMESVVFETYGPGGVALMIEGLTDNNNRTSQEVKRVLAKHGAALAGSGSAAWAFERKGGSWEAKTTLEVNETDGEALSKLVDELEDLDDVQEVYTNAA